MALKYLENVKHLYKITDFFFLKYQMGWYLIRVFSLKEVAMI